ncbi:MAG: MBOAT family protein, partial [Acetatifactor sp.]
MLFNSLIFIAVFLPLALAGWYLLQRLENPAYAKLFLIGMSLWFYGYYNISYLWILLVSLALNYVVSALLKRAGAVWQRKALFGVGIAINLSLLFYFKY